jgi:hypothetical protein
MVRNGYIIISGLATEKGEAVGLPKVATEMLNATPQDMIDGKYWGVMNEETKAVIRPNDIDIPTWENEKLTKENRGKILRVNGQLNTFLNEARIEVKKFGIGNDDAITNMWIAHPWLTLKDYIELNRTFTEAENKLRIEFLSKVNNQLDPISKLYADRNSIIKGIKPEELTQKTLDKLTKLDKEITDKLSKLDNDVKDYLGIKPEPEIKAKGILEPPEKISAVEEIPKKEKDDLLAALFKLLTKPFWATGQASASELFKDWKVLVVPRVDKGSGEQVNERIVYWKGSDGRWYGLSSDLQGKLSGFIVGSSEESILNVDSQAWVRDSYNKPIKWDKVTDCTTTECTIENLEFKKAYDHIKENGIPVNNYTPETNLKLLPDEEIPRNELGIIVTDKLLTDQRYYGLKDFKGFTYLGDGGDKSKTQSIFNVKDKYQVVMMMTDT